MVKSIVGSAVIGIILGFVAAKMQFLQWATLLPWGIVGLVIGTFGKTKKESAILGAVYGFFLGFAFMFGVYQGSAPIVTRIPFFTIIGLVSALCGSILSLLGSLFKKMKK